MYGDSSSFNTRLSMANLWIDRNTLMQALFSITSRAVKSHTPQWA